MGDVPAGSRRLRACEAPCEILLDGKPIQCDAGEPAAFALLAAAEPLLSRSVKYHRPRGLFCGTGHCGSCLARVDGEPNVRLCTTPVHAGMKIERQNVFPSMEYDLLAAADMLFPRRLDHHTLLTNPNLTLVSRIAQKVVRQLAGLGKLPDAALTETSTHQAIMARHVEVAVVGGGPAGLAAAQMLAERGREVLLLDEGLTPGGSYLAEPGGTRLAAAAVAAATAAGVEIASRAYVLAWYPEDSASVSVPPGLLAVRLPTGLLKLTARAYLYATGGYEQNALFIGNDRPLVISARATGRLLERGILVGKTPLLVGDTDHATRLAAALRQAGAKLRRIDGLREKLVAVHGTKQVDAATIEAAGKTTREHFDAVIVAQPPAPATELLRQHGSDVRFIPQAGGFVAVVDQGGRTRTKQVFAVGDVTGYVGPDTAKRQGQLIGGAIADEWELGAPG